MSLGNRGTTTQDDLCTGTGGTRGLGDVYTSNLTRQGVDGVGALVAHQLLGLQVVHCITQRLLVLADTECGYNNLVEDLVVGSHVDVHAAAAHGNLHGLAAHVGNDEHVATVGDD